MASFPSRVVNEICKKPVRLFTHALVFGLAALQFGCANIHSVSNEPSLPPETQAAILAGIQQTTEGQPFRFMELKKFNSMIKDLHETRMKIFSLSISNNIGSDPEKYVATLGEELRQYIKDNTIDGHNTGQQDDDEWVKKIDYGNLSQLFASADEVGGPSAVTLDKDPGGMHLLVIDNVDSPLTPTSVEKNFFHMACGLSILDKVLGPKMSKALRAYIVWHEAEHIADTRDLLADVRKLGELRDHQSELEVIPLKREIFADVESLEKFCKITGDKEFLMTIKHLRALSVVIAGDPNHATAFELEKVLKKVGAGEEDYPEMTPEETYEGVMKIRRAQKSFPAEKNFWKTEDTLMEEHVKFRYEELGKFIKGDEDLTPFQKVQLADSRAQNVLRVAHKAWIFFDQKLQQAGEKMPVPPPDIVSVSRRDVRGVTTPASPGGVAPK